MNANPDRWSKASSDSEASFFSSPGDIRLDLPRALDVKELLTEKAAFITGGTDQSGSIYITIPRYEDNEDEPFLEQFRLLLNYLASTRSTEEKAVGFSFLVDLRLASWAEIKPVMKIIQDSFAFKVNSAYVLKPDGFGGLHRASFNSSKFSFEVILTSSDGLVKYILPEQLIEEYCGSFHYDHFSWFRMRIAFEKFLYDSMALSTKLDEIRRRLLQDDYATDTSSIREQIHQNNHIKKWIVKAPIEILEEESNRVLDVIRDSCHCDNDDELSSEGLNALHQVRSMMETLFNQRTTLKELWQGRRDRLEKCLQFNIFKQDAETMLSWVQENRAEYLETYSDIGEDLESVEDLEEDHKQFEANCVEVQSKIDRVKQVGQRLQDVAFHDVDMIDAQVRKLEDEWKKLLIAVEKRSLLLASSRTFHRSSEQYMLQSHQWMEHLNDLDRKDISSSDDGRKLVSDHAALKHEMSSAYNFVSEESKNLLSALQTPCNDDRSARARSRVSDYSEAVSHVMEIILQIHEQNRQLTLMWEKQRACLSQKFKLCQFQHESDEVLAWIKDIGHAFIKENAGVGACFLEAENLQEKFTEFLGQSQEILNRGRNLADSVLQFSDTKECNPEELHSLATSFDKELITFSNVLARKSEALEMAKNFFKCTDQLSSWVNKFMDNLNLNEKAAVDCESIDTLLEQQRYHSEHTLDQLLNAVREGEELSKHLLLESTYLENKALVEADEAYAQQSRRVIENFLKQLNSSKSQLETLWRGKQEKLDIWVQLKTFERDCNITIKRHTEWMRSWEARTLANDFTKSQIMLQKFTSERHDADKSFDGIFSRGERLLQVLNDCGVEVSITDEMGMKLDSVTYMKNTLKSLEERKSELLTSQQKLHKNLENSVQLRRLELDAKRVAGWIRHGENILQANVEAGSSLVEAEALLREYEQFQIAIEKTKLGVMEVRETADSFLKNGHFDSQTISGCASAVETKWEKLMKMAERRRAVVFTSYNFYRASEQVSKLLEKFSKDCLGDEDPCLDFIEYELPQKQEKISAAISQLDKEKSAVEQGCREVRESSERFLRLVLPQGDGNNAPVLDGQDGRLEIRVNDLVEQATSQEIPVLKQMQLKKNVLQGCLEYAKFEESSKQMLQLIQDHTDIIDAEVKLWKQETKNGSLNTDNASSSQQNDFNDIFEEMRDKVKLLLHQAQSLIEKTFFHSDGVKDCAISVDKRYRECFGLMNTYRNLLEVRLGCSLPAMKDDADWPSISGLQAKVNELSSVTRREISSDSGIHEMTEEKRRSAKRIEFIMNELLQTERAYCSDLKCCIENFMYPMLDSLDVPSTLAGKHHIIFGNIEEIYEFHHTIFLQALEKYETRADEVGDCFCDWADKFHMYVEYCANKPESNALLIEYGDNFFEDLQAKRNLPLSIAAYLIKPVQRITKYQLLLKELMSCCDDQNSTLQAGLDVMLSVPRQANDTMYLCMIEGFNEGSLENLGKILLQDSFVIYDAKNRRKGKERHVFLFEQALLFSKEQKDSFGKVRYSYKGKLKTSELGITEHIAEDCCKFAVWTGEPPFTEEKRIIKAESIIIKQTWVKELRELIQQFQFGILRAKASFYPTSPHKKKKSSASSIEIAGLISNAARKSTDFETSTISSKTEPNENHVRELYVVTADHNSKTSEISVERGQLVEVLSKPPGSKSWRIRQLGDVLQEGFVPFSILRKQEDENGISKNGKRNSVETLNSHSSEESMNQSSDSTSSGRVSPSSRHRSKSVTLGNWNVRSLSKSAGKRLTSSYSSSKSPLPPLPSRARTISGGGSKKLQQLLGAPRTDIDLLLRPANDTALKSATLGRIPKEKQNLTLKKRISLDVEDAGFQEGDYLSEEESDSDMNEIVVPVAAGADAQNAALKKRDVVWKELMQTERDYIMDLEVVVKQYIQNFSASSTPRDVRDVQSALFGNIEELYEFHKGMFYPELQKIDGSPEIVGALIIKTENHWSVYKQYCKQRPTSRALCNDRMGAYLKELRLKYSHSNGLQAYLNKPVHRIKKYQSYLKDLFKYANRAGLDACELRKAFTIIKGIAKQSIDAVNVGMIEGFSGDLNSQGRLILQEALHVRNVKSKTRAQERHLFLFEQLLVFTEPFQNRHDLTVFLYRHGIKLDILGITENIDEDPKKFAVWTNNQGKGSELYFFTARSSSVKKAFVSAIKAILDSQLEQLKESSMRTSFKESKDTESAFQPSTTMQHFYQRDLSLPRSFSTSKSESSSQASVGFEKTRNVPHALQPFLEAASTLKHVKLIPLAAAKSLEDLTKAFPVQEKFIVMENYHAQSTEEMTVYKNDVVFFMSKHKKDPQLYNVRSFSRERSGYVPISLLKKLSEGEDGRKSKSEAKNSRLRRAASFGHEKPRRDRPKRIKSVSYSASKRKGDASKSNTKDQETCTENALEGALDRLSAKWTTNVDSSDGDDDSSDSVSCSLSKMLSLEPTTPYDVAPEFKILPRDVTADAPSSIKVTCTLIASPEPEIVWTKNDTIELTSGDRHRIIHKGSVCMLEILRSHPSDSGTYSVTATNNLGSASCCVKVTVRGLAKPGSPSKPYITAMTATSVVLAWDPPETLDRIPITAYTIEYKESSVSTWHVAAGVVLSTTTVIDDLVPNKTYQFRISANNEVGISNPSEPSDSITMNLETGVKRILSVVRKTLKYKSVQDSEQLHQPIIWSSNMQSTYSISSELGRGRFSLVKKCIEKSTSMEFAAKLVKKRVLETEMVENEIAILRVLNHPSLCKIYGTFDTPKNLILVLELLSGGRLFDHIVITDNLTERIAISFVKQIFQALQYLHECGIAHLDVKPENLLLGNGSSQRLKLIDFGDAVQVTDSPYVHELNGSPEFCAPEIMNGDPISLSTDLWSVGVIIYVLLSGVSPFYSDSHERSCQNITEIRYRFPQEFFHGISSEAKDLIEELLIHDQSHRPDTKECLRFPWIRMVEPGFKPQAVNERISLSRLAAFNARRRFQNEMVATSLSSDRFSTSSNSATAHRLQES